MSAALPPYAYVPGQTPRHPEDRFAEITDTVSPGMDTDQLTRTRAWLAGQSYYRAGYYWEAHEVLEPVWMQTAPGTAQRHVVQALIQLANARLKARMGKPRAVLRLCDIATEHLDQVTVAPGQTVMGLDLAYLRSEIEDIRRAIAEARSGDAPA